MDERLVVADLEAHPDVVTRYEAAARVSPVRPGWHRRRHRGLEHRGLIIRCAAADACNFGHLRASVPATVPTALLERERRPFASSAVSACVRVPGAAAGPARLC